MAIHLILRCTEIEDIEGNTDHRIREDRLHHHHTHRHIPNTVAEGIP
jgi:hypothetical protein